jgi:hypothetical protein
MISSSVAPGANSAAILPKWVTRMRSRRLRSLGRIGRDHHRHALVGERVYHLVDLGDGAEVDAAGRPIGDDELGPL